MAYYKTRHVVRNNKGASLFFFFFFESGPCFYGGPEFKRPFFQETGSPTWVTGSPFGGKLLHWISDSMRSKRQTSNFTVPLGSLSVIQFMNKNLKCPISISSALTKLVGRQRLRCGTIFS